MVNTFVCRLLKRDFQSIFIFTNGQRSLEKLNWNSEYSHIKINCFKIGQYTDNALFDGHVPYEIVVSSEENVQKPSNRQTDWQRERERGGERYCIVYLGTIVVKGKGDW